MTGNEIRRKFLDYFIARGHREVRSSSLVPLNDPTLLFTNAGMNQFKDVFLGLEQRDYKRATTSQKCVRAGGKHNDLENVGFTNRHLTFFEMLGNFSFGDYFKKDAIAFAWELITAPNQFALSLEKLYFTVFGGAEVAPGKTLGADDDAAALWAAVGAPKDRIVAIPGLKENFWAMGDTGPCGPCSEIHCDVGAAASDSGHTDCKFPCDCGRYVEIWNLVFMQFNRDSSGALNPLPKPSVDTGMGLDRMAAVVQGKISIFETDLFLPLIVQARGMIGRSFSDTPLTQASLRIIADHARATTFLISDGVIPSNDGRGYVLRKIMRRGLRHARFLGGNLYLLSNLAHNVAHQMKEAYPELLESLPRIQEIVRAEEERFSRTVDVGLKKLDEDLQPVLAAKVVLSDAVRELTPDALSDTAKTSAIVNKYRVPYTELSERARTLGISPPTDIEHYPNREFEYSGASAFRLYDTYGLPRDFIEDVTRDAGIKVDWEAFDRAMQEQRTRARASWKGAHKQIANPVYAKLAETFKTEPDFYFGATAKDCRIEAVIAPNQGSVNEIPAGAEAEVVLDRSSIYSESGGQVADVGSFYDSFEGTQLADVRGAYYPVAGLIAHRIVAKEPLRVGDRIATVADGKRREHIKRNHSGTHLMHAALRNILGTHVKQAGSLVEPGRLRFDFSHFAPVDAVELRDIEQQVNEHIRANNELSTDVMAIEDALASGALAFFGDRYPEANVRVVTIADPDSPRGFYSKELCGGTHVKRSGDLGIFKIVNESSVAAGVRRIEAISGAAALEDFQSAAAMLNSLASTLNTDPASLDAAAQKLIESRRQLEKQLDALKHKAAQSHGDELMASVRDVKGVKVVAGTVPEASRETLRTLADSLRQKLGSGVVVLGTTEDGKVSLISAVTKDLTAKVHAGKLIQTLAKQVGGTGGGRPDLAEAGGKDTLALNSTLGQVYDLVAQLL